MRTPPSILAATVATLFLLIGTKGALACSCFAYFYPGDNAELQMLEQLQQTDLIAEGVVATTAPLRTAEECRAAELKRKKECGNQTSGSCNDPNDSTLYQCQHKLIAEIDLTTVWKGSFGSRIKVNFERDTGGNCGLDLEPGTRILMTINADDAQTFHIGTCNSSPSDWIDSQDAYTIAKRGVWERYRQEWQMLREGSAKAPADVARLAALAAFLESNNDHLGTRDSYRRVITLRPDEPAGYFGAARASYALERFADAVAFARTAHELAPGDAEIETLYHRAKFQAGDTIDPSLVDFRGMKLSNRKFDGANLAGKNFSGAEFKDVSFRGAVLDRADFTNAWLNTVDFGSASLRQADFRPNPMRSEFLQTLTASHFQGADLTDARFEGVKLSIHSTWEGADDASALAAANLAGAHLSCDGLSQNDLSAVGPGGLELLWQKHIGDMRLIDNLRTQQPAVIVDADCATVVSDYLALPPTCRPWRLEASTHPYCGLPQ